MAKKVEVNEAELKAKLDPLSYEVLRNGATERPFTGEYTDSENVGIYRCKARVLPPGESRVYSTHHAGKPHRRFLRKSFGFRHHPVRHSLFRGLGFLGRLSRAFSPVELLPRDVALCFRRIEAFLECNERRRWRLSCLRLRAPVALLRGCCAGDGSGSSITARSNVCSFCAASSLS